MLYKNRRVCYIRFIESKMLADHPAKSRAARSASRDETNLTRMDKMYTIFGKDPITKEWKDLKKQIPFFEALCLSQLWKGQGGMFQVRRIKEV